MQSSLDGLGLSLAPSSHISLVSSSWHNHCLEAHGRQPGLGQYPSFAQGLLLDRVSIMVGPHLSTNRTAGVFKMETAPPTVLKLYQL